MSRNIEFDLGRVSIEITAESPVTMAILLASLAGSVLVPIFALIVATSEEQSNE